MVAAIAALGKPRTRTGPSRGATTPSSPSSRPTGTSTSEPRDAALQLHLGGSEQRNVRRGLLGHERQRDREGLLQGALGLAPVDPLHEPLERVSLPVRPRGPAAPLWRTERHAHRPAVARYGMDFALGYRFGMPFFIPVDYHDTARSSSTTSPTSRARTRSRRESNSTGPSLPQTFRGFGNGLFKFRSTHDFLDDLLTPKTSRTSFSTSSRPASAA